MKKIQGLHSVEDTQKESVVYCLNELVVDVFKGKEFEVLVNIQPDGKPMAEAVAKFLRLDFSSEMFFAVT